MVEISADIMTPYQLYNMYILPSNHKDEGYGGDICWHHDIITQNTLHISGLFGPVDLDDFFVVC